MTNYAPKYSRHQIALRSNIKQQPQKYEPSGFVINNEPSGFGELQ